MSAVAVTACVDIMQEPDDSGCVADASDVAHRQKLFAELVGSLLRDHVKSSMDAHVWDDAEPPFYLPIEGKCV